MATGSNGKTATPWGSAEKLEALTLPQRNTFATVIRQPVMGAGVFVKIRKRFSFMAQTTNPIGVGITTRLFHAHPPMQEPVIGMVLANY